ncbi:MAG: PorT family protein [Mediterranea sp.]|jgi:hypothetical protein|nr:PorT family protein [Mediterranea sp.]
MKKNILLGILCLFSVSALQAQHLRIGVSAGLNVSNPSTSATDGSRVGFNAGVRSEFGFSNVFKGVYLNAATLLSLQPYKSAGYYDQDAKTSSQWKHNAYYLNIPVHIGYKFALGSNTSLFINAGPYVSCGLFGKGNLLENKGNGPSKTTQVSSNVFEDKILERFDWGLGVQAGIDIIKHLQLAISYDWGLKNLYPTNDTSYKNQNFNVSCTYFFNLGR